jgi:hypothetical protein
VAHRLQPSPARAATSRLGRVAGQECVEFFCPSPKLRSGLNVLEGCCTRPQHPTDPFGLVTHPLELTLRDWFDRLRRAYPTLFAHWGTVSWQRPNIGSRVTREGHARFWERPEVKFLRATRQSRRVRPTCFSGDVALRKRQSGNKMRLC